MSYDSRIWPVTLAFLLGMSLILYIVTNTTQAWGRRYVDNATEDVLKYYDGFQSTIGLWKYCDPNIPESIDCQYIGSQKTCTDIDCSTNSDSCVKIRVARAFIITTCVLCGFSIVSLIISVMTSKQVRRILIIIATMLSIISILTGIVSIAVGVTGVLNHRDGDSYSWGGSAVIGIIGISINFSVSLALIFI